MRSEGIDTLFGSKTRVKLLRLFLSNPGKAFYVREITRLVDEQINSVRRELSNMLSVGIITSDSADNKLFYAVDEKFEHYKPLRAIFSENSAVSGTESGEVALSSWRSELDKSLPGVRVILASGSLVKDSASSIDILFVGNSSEGKLNKVVSGIEKVEGRDLNYSLMSYEEFHYRLSVRDRFVTEILNGRHEVILDEDKVLNRQK